MSNKYLHLTDLCGNKDREYKHRCQSRWLIVNQNLTFLISSFLCLCPVWVFSSSDSLSPRQVPSWSNSPQERAGKGYSLILSLSLFLILSVSPVVICISTRKAACVSMSVWVSVCLCVRACAHNSKGPGIPESCAIRASVVELPLCLSLCTPFSSRSRPGREEGKTVRGWDGGQKLLSTNSFSVSSPFHCPFPCVCFFLLNFYALSFGFLPVTDTLSLLGKAWKQSSLWHTQTHTHIHTHTHTHTHSHPPLSPNATPSASVQR